MGIFNKLFGRLRLTSDPNVTTQTTTVIQTDTTNSGIAIVPNGTGAITASIPDGTVAGGNARGQYAVDLQRARLNPTDVAASPYSVIVGGQDNELNGGATHSIIVGGYNNRMINSDADYAFIGGGQSNVITSQNSTISGGQSNTASTGTHATVVGGQSNTSSGQYSVSGGNGNTASSFYSVALGVNNIASNSGSLALGVNTISSAPNSTSIGERTNSYLYGQFAHQSGRFAGAGGDAQASTVIARKLDTLTTGGTTVLSLDGTGTTNLIIPNGNNRAWNVTVEYVAVCTAQGSGTTVVGDVVTGTDKFRFKRVGGTSTIGAVTNIELTRDATMTSSNCTYAVGTSNSLQITFVAPTTANATTFRVVAKVSLVEVAW